MGCFESKQRAEQDAETSSKSLLQWTAAEIEQMLETQPVLRQYASTALRVLRAIDAIQSEGVTAQGTVGAVFAHMTDDVLREAGIANGLHRMQILHLRDALLVRDTPQPPSQPSLAASIQSWSAVQKQSFNCSHNIQSTTNSGDVSSLDGKKHTGPADVEGGKYMAMMKILPSGNLIRVVGETLPLAANGIASRVVRLHEMHSLALYNVDNCRRFVKRCCQIQSLFSAQKIKTTIHNVAIIQILEEILNDGLEFFALFSQKGWLERVLHRPSDKSFFQELDRRIITACVSPAFLNVSEASANNLLQMPIYTNSSRHLRGALLDAGGMEGLRQSHQAVEELAAYFPDSKQQHLDDRIQEETLQYEMQIDNPGSESIIRHPELKVFWRRAFSNRDRITWDEFWKHFPQILKHEDCPILCELMKRSQNREIVQRWLTRALSQLLSAAELDFAFVPQLSVEETLQKLLTNSSQLSDLQSMSKASSISFGEGPIKDTLNWNFPDAGKETMERSELLMQLLFGVQDRGTKLLQLTGPPGCGKSVFAQQAGRYLLSTGHWTEAYWIDLAGIHARTAAGYQLMCDIGILYETADLKFLQGFLERREASVGLVITGLEALLITREDESRFLDDLESLVASGTHVQILLLSHKELRETRPCMVHYPLQPFSLTQCQTWLQRQLAEYAVTDAQIEQLLMEVAHPLCLNLISKLIRMGERNLEEILEALYMPPVVELGEQMAGQGDTGLREKELSCLFVCLLGLDDELLHLAIVLSLSPGSFTLEFALAYAEKSNYSQMSLQSCVRKLCNRGILSFNSSAARYKFHVLIRSACQLLSKHLGLEKKETTRNFLHAVYSKCIWKAEQTMQHGSLTSAALSILHQNQALIYHLMDSASHAPFAECLPIYQKFLWESMSSLSSRFSYSTLESMQGNCSVPETAVDAAAEFYEACLKLAEQTQDSQFKVQSLIQTAELYRNVGRVRDSENTLREALALCFSKLAEEAPETARCYEGIGLSCLMLKKAPCSVENYQKALELHSAVSGGKSIQVAKCSLALGKALSLVKKHEDAYHCCLKAVEIFKELHGPDHVLVARAVADGGAQLKHLKKEREAEQAYRRALAIMERSLGPDHPDVAIILAEFSTLLRGIKKLTAAEPMLLRALQIRECSFGPLHPETAFCIQNLAALYKAMHRCEDAVRFATRDVDLRKRICGPADLEVSSALMTLALVLIDSGDYAGAHRQCKRALNVREKQLGGQDVSVAQSCNVMGIALRYLGKYEEAKAFAERGLKIKEHKFGDRPHPEIAASLNGLAEIERDLGEFSVAEMHCRKGLEIRKKAFAEGHLSISLSLQSLASILAEVDQLEEAEQLVFHSLQIREKQFGAESFACMQGYDILSTILCRKQQLEAAEEKAHTSVDVKIKTLGHNHPEVGRSLLVLSEALAAQASHAAAKQKIQRAMSVFSCALGEDHPQVLRARQTLQRLEKHTSLRTNNPDVTSH